MTSSPYHENLQSIPVRITNRNYNKSQITPLTTYSNLITVPFKTQNIDKRSFVPKILLTNTMSLTPKIDEVSCFMKTHNPDVACITETWLHGSIDESCLYIAGYNFIFKNRSGGCHGGVGLYIKNSISFKCLDHLQHPVLKVLWVCLAPKRLPRGFPCLVISVIYHPPNADDREMLSYLSTSLTTIESDYPGCGLMLAGDFNRLKVNRLLNQFQCKQMVNVPTRVDQTLGLIITNLYSFYANDSVEKCPPFGLSDHDVVILNPRNRCDKSGSRKLVITRDMRPSRKSELGRYLTSCNWSILDHLKTCEEKLELFTDLINLGINTIMPNKRITLHVNDPPWITANFKNLIKKRQAAFSNGNIELFRYYRNRVNRERKICREKFYSSKVEHLKKSKPSRWWREVKQIAGMTPLTGAEDLFNQIQIDDMDRKSPTEIANFINTAFLDPMKIYQPLASLPYDPNNSVLQLDELDVYKVLASLNPRKASGPDGVSNWVLNEYAEILAQPVCSILNSSFNEQQLPISWKTADIVPIIKSKPVTEICKHLRPISLTPALSKVAEEFVVSKHIGPAILCQIDRS